LSERDCVVDAELFQGIVTGSRRDNVRNGIDEDETEKYRQKVATTMSPASATNPSENSDARQAKSDH
jgi:hypothetical protein